MTEPTSIKITEKEVELFENMQDKQTTLEHLAQQFGMERRMLWEGLRTRYNFSTDWQWAYDRKLKVINPTTRLPDYMKKRVGLE